MKLINTNTFNSYSVVLRFVQPQQILVHVDKATDEEDAIRQITEQLENNGITEVEVLSVINNNTPIKTINIEPESTEEQSSETPNNVIPFKRK